MPIWLQLILILLAIIVIFPFVVLFILIIQYIIYSFLDMLKNKREKKHKK
mgnify:CR=1 FL=1